MPLDSSISPHTKRCRGLEKINGKDFVHHQIRWNIPRTKIQGRPPKKIHGISSFESQNFQLSNSTISGVPAGLAGRSVPSPRISCCTWWNPWGNLFTHSAPWGKPYKFWCFQVNIPKKRRYFQGWFTRDPQGHGTPENGKWDPYKLPISLGNWKWEWYGNSMGPA